MIPQKENDSVTKLFCHFKKIEINPGIRGALTRVRRFNSPPVLGGVPEGRGGYSTFDLQPLTFDFIITDYGFYPLTDYYLLNIIFNVIYFNPYY